MVAYEKHTGMAPGVCVERYTDDLFDSQGQCLLQCSPHNNHTVHVW